MTYPTDPGFSTLDITDNEAVLLSESIDLSTNARSLNGHRWEIYGKYPPLTRTEAGVVMAYIKSQRGSSGTFSLTLPEYSDSNGTASGTMRINNGSGYAIGSTSVVIDGITGALVDGDFIKFANHNKVYMVTDISGSTLTVYPSLTSAVVDNEEVTYSSVPFTVRLSKSKNSMSVSSSNRVSLAVNFIEAK